MRDIADSLPPLTSSYFVNFPNIDIQMPSLQASTLNDQSMPINVPGSSYHLDANYGLLRDDDPLPNFPYQPFLHDYPSSSSDFDTILYQQSTVLSTKPAPVLQFQDLQNNNNITNARKRKIEEVVENSSWPLDDGSDSIGNVRGKKLKRNKTHLAVKEKQPAGRQTQEWVANDIKRKLLTPGRRSHKLSDKITSLQKLVSPFGKTDTASVLQEASLHIKLLQEQIQNLFQMLSRTYDSFGPLHLEKGGMEVQGDLRSRGLCLVPASVIQKVAAKEEQIATFRI